VVTKQEGKATEIRLKEHIMHYENDEAGVEDDEKAGEATMTL
jgi:hypothetical protein